MAESKVPALGWWGLGNIVNALGILGLIVGPAAHLPLVSVASSALLTVAMGLIWKAARSLDHKWAPFGLAVLGGAVVGLAGAVPATRSHIDFLNLSIAATYLLAASGSLWFARQERLAARWPLIVLTALHAAILASGAYAFFDGAMGHGRVPAVMSLFGLIHFESIVFVLGTAVFLLALVKERSEAASKAAANTDPLTGVANRGGFMLRAERVVERCRFDGTPVSVMMFDLDRFKGINDSHGHAAGDAVLLQFCEVAAAALRANDVLGRIGGEEFAVVLPGSGIEAGICARRAHPGRVCRDLPVRRRPSGRRHRQRRCRDGRRPRERRGAARRCRCRTLHRQSRGAKSHQALRRSAAGRRQVDGHPRCLTV